MPSITLKQGKFSDTGYRFRKNNLSRDDNWAPFTKAVNNDFYELLHWNTDVFDVPKDEPTNKIAEMYFRLNHEKINHSRKVFELYQLLGSVGGASYVLFSIFKYMIGGYCQLNLVVEIMTELYNDKFTQSDSKVKLQSINLMSKLTKAIDEKHTHHKG